MNSSGDIDSYIAGFPEATRVRLESIRATIKAVAPDAREEMSYGMPAYKLKGKPLVYFAGYKGHIGFYATPSGHTEFASELAAYKQGKGSVQFPLDQPLPLDLIERMVRFRVRENLQK